MSWLLRCGLSLGLVAGAGCSSPGESATPPPKAERGSEGGEAAPKAASNALPRAAVPAAPEAGGASAFDAAMQAVIEPYLMIQDALARDSVEGVSAAAARLAAATGGLKPETVTGEHAGHYTDVPAKLSAGAKAVGEAADLAAARDAFKQLSMPMGMWATMAKPAGLDLVYCPMAKGSWIQKTGPIRNPYHGSEMLACGEVVSGPGKVE